MEEQLGPRPVAFRGDASHAATVLHAPVAHSRVSESRPSCLQLEGFARGSSVRGSARPPLRTCALGCPPALTGGGASRRRGGASGQGRGIQMAGRGVRTVVCVSGVGRGVWTGVGRQDRGASGRRGGASGPVRGIQTGGRGFGRARPSPGSFSFSLLVLVHLARYRPPARPRDPPCVSCGPVAPGLVSGLCRLLTAGRPLFVPRPPWPADPAHRPVSPSRCCPVATGVPAAGRVWWRRAAPCPVPQRRRCREEGRVGERPQPVHTRPGGLISEAEMPQGQGWCVPITRGDRRLRGSGKTGPRVGRADSSRGRCPRARDPTDAHGVSPVLSRAPEGQPLLHSVVSSQ